MTSRAAADLPRRGAEAGFTLIEVLVVLAVLGLALGLVISRGPVRSRALEAQAAASEVAQGLRLARARAIAGNRPVSFTVDLAAHAFRIGDAPPRPLPPGLGVSVITINAATRGGRLAAIGFAPDGSSTGGRIELADGARRLQVGVDWLTGRVSVADAR